MSSAETQTFRARAFAAIASAATRRPGLLLALLGLLALGAGLLLPGMRISTSRHALVAPDNPYQARVLRFAERFGPPDSPVLVVSGGAPEARRRFTDRLAPRLTAEPALRGRVLARVGPEEIAEVLLLQRPEALDAIRRRLGPDRDLAALVEGGLPAWIGAVEGEIQAGLEGGGKGGALPGGEAGLAQLAAMARALDAALAGDRAAAAGRLAAMGRAAGAAARPGIDEEGYLTTGGGEVHLVVMFPDLPGDEGQHVTPVVQRIRALRDEALAEAPGAGVATHLTGLPALAADELPIIARGLYQTSILSTAGIVLILVVAFRSLRRAVLCLIPLGAGTLITLGAARLLFGELNLITSAFVSVLLGLGIDFGVYLLSRHGELAREGVPIGRGAGSAPAPLEASAVAMRETLVRTGPGIVTGAVTTMLAFLTTATTEFTAYAQLGVLTALGLGVMVLCAFLLVPALVAIGARRRARASASASAPAPAPAPAPARLGLDLGRLAPLVRAGRRAIPLLAAAGVVAGALSITSIRWRGRYFDFIPAHTESAAGLALIEHDPVTSPLFATVTARGVEEARAAAAALRALPSVASVETPSDLLPPLDAPKLAALRAGLSGPLPDPGKLAARPPGETDVAARLGALADALDEVAFALRQAGRDAAPAADARAAVVALKQRLAALPDGGRAAIAALEADAAAVLSRALAAARRVAERGAYAPEDLPPLLARRFVSRDAQALALYARPAGDIWNGDVARAFSADVERVDPSAAGIAVTIHAHERMIRSGFERAAGIAVVLVFLIVLADFRSLRDALVALVPLAAGWVWTLGAMRLLGLSFDVANIVVLPLLLGVGVDAGAHMMHRCRESAEARGGVADVEEILRGTGAAVVVASTTTIVGFAALMAGDYGAMKSFGLIMTIGMLCCLGASVIVLPAVLVLIGRAR